MESIPRPEVCAVCWKRLPQGTRGRPRTTCGARCRKRKQRKAIRYGADEFYAKTREAWQIIKRWERRFGELTQTYPEWGALTLRDRLLIRLQRDWPIAFCVRCERPYVIDVPGSTDKYCSEECHGAEKRGQSKVKGAESRDRVVAIRKRHGLAVRRCDECGIEFAPTNRRQHFHSHACRTRAYRGRWKVCKGCGEKFHKKSVLKFYCTKNCYLRTFHKQKRQAELEQQSPRICAWCGETFRVQLGEHARKYCKAKCRTRHMTFKLGKSKRLPRRSPLRVHDRYADTPEYRD